MTRASTLAAVAVAFSLPAPAWAAPPHDRPADSLTGEVLRIGDPDSVAVRVDLSTELARNRLAWWYKQYAAKETRLAI